MPNLMIEVHQDPKTDKWLWFWRVVEITAAMPKAKRKAILKSQIGHDTKGECYKEIRRVLSLSSLDICKVTSATAAESD